MFSNNLKTLRKARGLSQEELATRLHVVRQTISKWEKGLSVPDAALLVRLAELLETPVSTLLGAELPPGGELDPVAEQLSRINEQLAVKTRRARRVWQVVAGVVAGLVALQLLLLLLSAVAFTRYREPGSTTVVSGERQVEE